jgi:hypothetical protein
VTAATIDGLDGVRPFVEIGVGSAYTDASIARWDVARWDDPAATWAGTAPLWLDVTCHVLDVSTAIGRQRAVDKWEVGTATVVCENRDGWADFPRSMAEAEDDDTLLTVRPGRSIRVGVQVGGDPPVTLFGGYIDAANPTYDAVDGARMTLECIDAKGDAGRADLVKLAVAAGLHETVTARLTRILNAASWPSYRRQLDASNVAMRATTLGAKAIDLMDRAADSAGGQVFGDVGGDTRDPAVAFRGRDWLDYPASAPPVGTIGNFGWLESPGYWAEPDLVEDPPGSGLIDPGTVGLVEDPPGSGLYLIAGQWVPAVPADTCPSTWELEFGRDDVTTRAILGRQGEVERTFDDAAGIRLLGVEPFTNRNLETDTDADVTWLGERILAGRNWRRMPRVAAVTINAKGGHPETVGTLAAADPFTGARFRCQHHDGTRVIFNRIMMVVGVEHTLTPTAWSARIALDDAEPFLIGGPNPAHWDEAGVALWDAATWADPT